MEYEERLAALEKRVAELEDQVQTLPRLRERVTDLEAIVSMLADVVLDSDQQKDPSAEGVRKYLLIALRAKGWQRTMLGQSTSQVACQTVS